MTEKICKILLIEPNQRVVDLVSSMIQLDDMFDLVHVYSLYDGMEKAVRDGCCVIISDIQLPDAGGEEVAQKLSTIQGNIPVILVSEKIDHKAVIPFLRHGAQDFLNVSNISSADLHKALVSALERKAYNDELYKLVVIDELTQLYNRRGFNRLAQRQLDMARRQKQPCCLVFIDLDNLKAINDTLGHSTGDQAIIEIALTLRKTLRSTDIIGRLGGDEFVVMAPDITEDRIGAIIARFQRQLTELNADQRRAYVLAASIGIAPYNPNSKISLSQLQDVACHRMHSHKATKSHRRGTAPPMLARDEEDE